MVYTLRFFFSSKCSLFHNSDFIGFCIIHILYTGCAKIKKNNSGAKRLNPVRYIKKNTTFIRLIDSFSAEMIVNFVVIYIYLKP